MIPPCVFKIWIFWPRTRQELGKNGYVRFLVQTGDKRNHRLPDTPTIWELMDQEKVSEAKRRLARVILRPWGLWSADSSDARYSRGSGQAAARSLH